MSKSAETPPIRLPRPEDGFDGLDEFVKVYGLKNVHDLFKWARERGDTMIGDFTAHKIGEAIVELMTRNPDMTAKAARLKVAKSMGYSGPNLSNFYLRYANRGYEMVTGRTIDEDGE